MALKKCNECGQEVSTQAKACPNCGAKDPLGVRKKGCLVGCGVMAAFVLFVVIVVVASLPGEEKPPMPYQVSEEYDLPPYKWQLDVRVDKPLGGTLEQAKLEALARIIAARKKAALGNVERWWVSFYFQGVVADGPFALVSWEKGREEFKWVPANYPPGFKGAAK